MNNKNLRTIAVLVTLMLVFASVAALAQTSRGTVTGIVTDSSGATVKGATATLTDRGTNVSRNTVTNGNGIYRFDAVVLGQYNLAIDASGFSKATATDLTVEAARPLALDFSLKIGTASTDVSVDGTAAEALQTTEQTRGRNIDPTYLASLPITNQDSLNLITTLPGVIPSSLNGSLDSGIGSVNGSRARGNNFMVDGVENNDISVAGPAVHIFNNDAIQEVNIQTSNFSAEFGRAGGAVVNQVTKSGTNSVHGTMAWVYLSEVFNASNQSQRISFNPASGKPLKGKSKENIPAFTIGGPVYIPHVYDGRDKTFFFGAGQWDRFLGSGALANFNVPTANGIATLQALSAACPNVSMYLNSLNGAVAPAALGTIPISIPANVFAATGSCNGNARTGQVVEYGLFGRSAPNQDLANNNQARIDHRFTDKHQISARWLYYDEVAPNGGTTALSSNYDANFSTRTMQMALTDTYVINNRMTNEFRFNFGRINPQFPLSNSAGIGGVQPTFAYPTLDSIGASAVFPQGRTANNYQYQDTVSLVKGAHSVRMGVDLLRQLARQSAPVNSRGALNYNSSVAVTGIADSGIVTGFANFIDDFAGPGSSPATRQFGSPVYRPNLFRQSYFVQDQWRMTPGFTLNVGLRYENFGQPANFFPYPAATLDPTQFGKPSHINSDNNNFAPSLGFAWNPKASSGSDIFENLWNKLNGDGKLVVRGGFQTTYDSLYNNLLSNMAAGNPNNVANLPVLNTITATNPRGVANISQVVFPTLGAAPLNPLTNGLSQFAPNMPNPYTDRFSLGIQRELPWKLTLDTSYVGSLSRKLYSSYELNPFMPNATFTSTGTRVVSTIGGRNVRCACTNSNYNSLQVNVKRQTGETFLGALTFDSSYTWSRNMDVVTETFATNNNNASLSSAQFVRLSNPNVDYGPSDNDRRHRWVSSVVWDIKGPKTGIAGQVLGGWELGYVIPIQSGTPYQAYNGVDRDLDGTNGADRPDIGNPNAPFNTRGKVVGAGVCSTLLQNPDNGTCVTANDVHFVQVTTFSLPNGKTAGRNNLYTSSSALVNMDVLKRFSLSERWKFEYRAEIFNVANHQNYNFVPVGTSINSATAGHFLDFSQSNAGNRSMRMGLKLIF